MIHAEGKPLVVTGLGMVCSLGLDHVTACAAARAGILRIREIKTLNVTLSPGFGRETPDGMPTLAGHAVPDVGHGFSGVAKLLALGAAALQDLWQHRPLAAAELSRTGIFLNVSDRYLEEIAAERDPLYDESQTERPAAAWREATQSLVARLVQRCKLPIDLRHQRLIHGGHAGWVEAIQLATQELAAGTLDRCIVGGVDSCLEPDFLLMADELGILKTDDQPAGFLPGEAAAFCLLERADSAGPGRDQPGHVRLVSASQADDGAHLFSESPPLGRGWEQALRATLQGAGGDAARADWLVVDLNGLERRALDWGHAAVRLRHLLGQGEAPVWIPAASFGEVGAATGPVALCLVVRAFQRGYAPGRQALIVLGSDSGRRGAVLVRRDDA